MGEGTHFRLPWFQTPHQFDVRIRPRNISSNTGTKDLQVVTINLRVLSRPEEEFLPDIFSSLGLDYDERVLPSIGNEVLKAVVAQYNAESLITKREEVSREVRTALTKRAAEFHIKLDDVAITGEPSPRRSRSLLSSPPPLPNHSPPPPFHLTSLCSDRPQVRQGVHGSD